SSANWLNHYGQPLGRTGDAGVEPALAALRKCERLVEQHHVVPLRALRLVDGEHVAEIKLVVLLAQRPFERLDRTGEAFRPHRHFPQPAADPLLALKTHAQDLPARPRPLLDQPQPAVEQTLAPVVAQADELVTGDRERVVEAAAFAQPRVVGAAGRVAARPPLLSVPHPPRGAGDPPPHPRFTLA